MQHDAIAEADRLLQRAALMPEEWPRALQYVADLFNARGAVLLPLDGRVPGIPHTRSCADLVEVYFRDDWAGRDERYRCAPKLRKGDVVVDQDFASAEFMARSPYYREFLEPLGFRWFAGLGLPINDDLWCLALQRTPDEGCFSPKEQQKLRVFRGMLARAGVLAHLRDRAAVETLDALCDLLPDAAILLDRHGRVVRHNARAEPILGVDLFVSPEGLHTVDHRDTDRLRRHVTAALWSQVHPGAPFLKPIRLDRKDAGPLLIQARHLGAAQCSVMASARILLVVKDIACKATPPASLIREFLGLTPAEARLAGAMQRAHSLVEAAGQLGICHETARSQIKAIFAKTQTKSQMELAVLLSRLPPVSGPWCEPDA